MKSQSNTIFGTHVSFWRSNDGSIINGPSSGSSLAVRDYVTPGAMINGNHRDPNDWAYDILFVKCFRGRIDNTDSGNPPGWGYEDGWHGSSSQDPAAPSWDRTDLYNMALENLNSQVRGSLDLAVTAAESKQTLRMIAALKKVTDYARGTGGLANGWLAYQYGWRPLMSDVYNIADESTRLILSTLKTFKGRATLPIEVDDVVTRNVHAFGAYVNRRGKGKQSCRIVLTLELPAFDLARWTSLNPVSLAWELIPYSFVVDWFVDVGSYMRNLETALWYGVNFRNGYTSELFKYEGTETVLPNQIKTIGNSKWFYGGQRASIRKVNFRRTVLASYPLPRIPSFRADLSSTRLFSAAALLRQLLK